MQLVNFRTDGLEQRCNGDGFLNGHWHIAYAELNSIEERVYAKIPPYFFCVVNAICFHQQLHIIFVRFNAVEIFRYASPWEFVKHLCAERFVACFPSFPKR